MKLSSSSAAGGELSAAAAGQLLSEPMAPNVRSEVKYHRVGMGSASHEADGGGGQEYKNTSDRFSLGRRDFHRQYFHVYGKRLSRLSSRVASQARIELGPDVVVKRLCDLATASSAPDADVLVIGTVFKDQQLKPNILKELSAEHGLAPQPISNGRRSYVCDSDTLILEDDLQRIRLHGHSDMVNVGKFVTGIVCGLFGHEIDGGRFLVKKIIFPEIPAQLERPILAQDRYIAFISGLELGGDSGASLLPLQLAVDWLGGDAGEMGDQRNAADVQRVVIAGNSLNESARDKDVMSRAAYLTKNAEASSVEAVKSLDHFLVQLASSLPVDVMPGEFDPANQIMPQQPLHKCLFPTATPFTTMQTVTNPYAFELLGLSFIGTAGQPTEDVLRNTTANAGIASAADAMEASLTWSHLSPTCPDTLGCFPYHDEDPFIIDHAPHVYFTGNQDKFEKRLFTGPSGQKTLILCLPKFSETHSVTLLNLRSFETKQISFEANLFDGDAIRPQK